MKYYFGIIYIFISFSLFAQRTIIESENMRFRAQVRQDTTILKQLVTDDMMYIHSNALVEHKADFIHTIGSGNITYQSMQSEGERSIRYFGKTGISNGVVHAAGLINGAPFDIRLRYTGVYVKQKGKWRLASWQSTSIK